MKKIGIVAWGTSVNTFGVTTMYADFFSKFGVVEMIMPNETEARDLDLLVLPGGPDVDTRRYLEKGDKLSYWTQKPCPYKERFDAELLPLYMEKNTPIFGICRGHQTLYVELGGKLFQDLWEEGYDHPTNGENRKTKVHFVKTNARAAQGLALQLPAKFEVNSIHHQAVDHRHMPQIGTVLACHTSKAGNIDGIIEAMTYFPDYPAHTVQWHPEEIRDDFSIALIEQLLTLND